MQINLVTNVGNVSNLHVLFTQDIQDFAHIILRYMSKISSDEASGGDLKLYVTDAAKRKHRREKKLLGSGALLKE